MSTEVKPSLYFGPLHLDAANRSLLRDGQPVQLTPKAFDVLFLLARNAGRLVCKDEIMQAVWPDTFVNESNLTQTIFMLRKALGNRDGQRHIVTVPGRGYRFAAAVRQSATEAEQTKETLGQQANDSVISEKIDPVTQPDVAQSRAWMMHTPVLIVRIGIAITVLVLLGGVARWSLLRSRVQASVGKKMLAVLPFENLTGDPAQDYFSDGLTEEMIAQVGRVDPENLNVIARTSVMNYKHSPKSVTQIGHELGAQYVLEGSVRREASQVRVTAQLIQVKDQGHLWARQYDRELSGLLSLQGEIAEEIANEIELTIGTNKTASTHNVTLSPKAYEAYDLYLKGRYFWNKRTTEGFHKAIEYFQQAIAADPNFARAYAGLADTYGLMSTWHQVSQTKFMPKARAAALKALQIDDTLAEAHTSLALVAESYDYDWQTAERELRRAIQLDPSYATAHQWYAEYLSRQGRFDEALVESERARQLDPLSLIIATDHGVIQYQARQYDRAIKQLSAVEEMDPSYDHAHVVVLPYVHSGRFEEALADLEKWRQTGTDDTTALNTMEVYVYSRWGRQREAQRAMARLERRLHDSHTSDLHNLLLANLAMNRRDEAITLLQKAYSERSDIIVGLKVDPNYDVLRNDPRFQRLLQQVRLAN
jgi:TolB-like protein/DNA-binding winged helix-turn-helix (wHTH) protein/Tfp pilus assembly protein PilF